MGTTDLLQHANELASAYLEQINDQPVSPNEEGLAHLAQFDERLPEKGTDAKETLDLLHRHGSPATVTSAGGRYFGYVIGGALPVSVGANWVATAWDQCPGLRDLSPIC